MVVKVLVVDDDETILNTFVDLLESFNIKVVGTATNGKQAVEQYTLLRPDVVFLDIMMPEYDGHYGLEQIRKLDSNSNVVMVTGAGNEEIEKLDRLNPSAIVHKPYQMCTILHVLKEELCLKVD